MGCLALTGPDHGSPGFKLRVYDKGSQSDLYYQQFAFGQTVGGDGGTPGNVTAGTPFGPYFPVSPLVISSPGILQIEVTNLDPNNNQAIQALLSFAVPKGSVSGNVVIQEE